MNKEDEISSVIRGMFLNLDKKIDQLEARISRLSPIVGNGGNRENESDAWIDAQDVMRLLRISQRTLATLRQNGTLAYSRIGHKIYYKKHDIDEVLRNAYVMYRLSAHGKEEGGAHGRL